jgi:type I restriction enzyme M protein
MDQATHNKIVSFIWGIADDVLRDLFKRGKYPDVILPMCVIRPMDAVLEPTPAFRKDDTPLNRKPGGLMEQSNASLQRGDQG